MNQNDSSDIYLKDSVCDKNLFIPKNGSVIVIDIPNGTHGLVACGRLRRRQDEALPAAWT